MKTTKTKLAAALVAAALPAFALATAAQAQDFTPKTAGTKMINVRITDVSPTGTDPITTLAGASTGLRADVNDDVMPTLGLAYFMTDHVAFELVLGTTQHTVRAKGGATNAEVLKTWVLPPVLSVQYHFAPDKKVSPYVGAGVNYMLFYSGTNKNGFDLKVDDGFGAALNAGVDIATTGPWSLNLDAKKVFFETDAVDTKTGVKSKVTLNPWVLSAGFGYRF